VKRLECLRALAGVLTDEIVLTNVGPTRAEWEYVRPHEANLYQAGLGNVVPMGLGIALGQPQARVVALDGDGSILLIPGSLATVAAQAPPNYLVVIFDNEAYESTGGQPSATARTTDLEVVARGFGFRDAVTARTVDEFTAAAQRSRAAPGPSLIVAKVQIGGGRQDLPAGLKPSTMDGKENKYRFARYVESQWGRPVLRGPEYSSGHSPHVRRARPS
jgi:thiamine pyrophosphate-dependent acetolactate synthase large subunit-like protein